jgi:hypothetical protein
MDETEILTSILNHKPRMTVEKSVAGRLRTHKTSQYLIGKRKASYHIHTVVRGSDLSLGKSERVLGEIGAPPLSQRWYRLLGRGHPTGDVKGIVQRKLRWVEIGIKQ